MDKNETLEGLFGDRPYQTLVQEINDFAIIHLNAQGEILSWNKGAESIFGYLEDEIISQNFSVIFTPEDRAQGIPENELSKAKITKPENRFRKILSIKSKKPRRLIRVSARSNISPARWSI